MCRRCFYGNQHTLGDELDYDYEDMLEDVVVLAEELGRPPTTRDAERDSRLPGLKRIYKLLDEKTWNDLLADASLGQTQVGEYGPEERPYILDDIRTVFEETSSPHLTVREYSEQSNYNKSVVKRLFGTWSNACDLADVPHGRKHGVQCEGPNGEILESRFELEVAVALDERDVEYVTHKSITNTRWRSDFYLPEMTLWIEVDGYIRGQRPNRDSFEEKLQHYEREGMDYIVVQRWRDLEKKVFERS